MATCISLKGSTQCPAWNGSSISTSSSLYTDFPFMQNVTSIKQFDQELSDYVKGSYVTQKYVDYLGCQGANLTDTDDFYARYTTSSICSGLVQSSKTDCDLSDNESRPLCADTCALMATSEATILLNPDLCPKRAGNYMSQVRSDFTVCALPADSLTVTCISGADNESDECGYGSNLVGLCGFCGASSPNSTDSCCINSNAATRCKDVTIPTSTTIPPIFTSTSSPTAGSSSGHLSGGQIAGAVIGTIAGVALLAALAALALICWRRKRRARNDNVLNQPNPQRKGFSPMQPTPGQQGFAPIPGGRVARMSALREAPSYSPGRSRNSAALFGVGKHSESSDSDYYGASPGAMSKKIPPTAGKRTASLSSNSALAGAGSDGSPRSGIGGQYSSPDGMASGQSEQLSSFHDYYSQDDIRPGDKVAVLWAYQPRAGDEFALDRGEMLKIVGIWDDGWATGIRVPESAEDYDARHREQRDSGVSNGSHRPIASPSPNGEIKAFPLVCVCLPQHWRKIIDGGQADDTL
ncbi:SH3 domain protein [Aspergillus flavus]|nr:SH3 domain protein [Aspergillus flavus]